MMKQKDLMNPKRKKLQAASLESKKIMERRTGSKFRDNTHEESIMKQSMHSRVIDNHEERERQY